MNVASWLLWGFVGTVVLTTMLSASQALGMTRLNVPFLLGAAFAGDRDRAKAIGFVVHLLDGWLFSLLYVAAFQAWHRATIALGVVVGLVHAAFVLVVVMGLLPAVHPRMASEQAGPTELRSLEPPGFLALHYGAQTPVSIIAAHAVFGAILGAFYRVV